MCAHTQRSTRRSKRKLNRGKHNVMTGKAYQRRNKKKQTQETENSGGQLACRMGYTPRFRNMKSCSFGKRGFRGSVQIYYIVSILPLLEINIYKKEFYRTWKLSNEKIIQSSLIPSLYSRYPPASVIGDVSDGAKKPRSRTSTSHEPRLQPTPHPFHQHSSIHQRT